MTHDYAITSARKVDGFKVLTIDTARARYFDLPWKSLGDFGKRKFENLLIINDAENALKITYA